ncbi:DUF2268 domain-containing putative Zn-dependent protease [Paracoccus rhizosphaerae]|uniref:DUF2268 domain-containing putative Zn-dependent protease n=1 Tax=Paracoccus rhizosphaerae TaxID=1133347 RepID=A0ABV6CJH7_9RHOB|nr:DUF2268 domain-containing putative Zn-dependent protease [Paracoccus rhizosphaerae]
MTIWHLHLLNARNALTGSMSEIRAAVREAVALAEDHATLPRFDLVVRAGDATMSDRCVGGQVPAPGQIEITLMPDRFDAGHLRRAVVRELHHLLRRDGPGFGLSLGDALVSEGLAGHFVLRVLGGAADPWDAVRPGPGMLRQAGNLWARHEFDFAEWFLGRGKIRRWTGYGVGHMLVAEHLAQMADESAASLTGVPADAFRPALRRLIAGEGGEEPEESEIASRDAGGPAPRTPRDI